MALHDVTPQAAVHRGGTLQVDWAAHRKCGQTRAVQRLGHHIGAELSVRKHVHHGQAHTVDGDRIAVAGVGGHQRATDHQTRGITEVVGGDDLAELLDDSGEHAA